MRKILALLLAVPLVFLVGLPYAQATEPVDLEMSYHGTLGHLLTEDVTDHEQGMLEKWCALPNLTIAEDGFVGPGSWTARCGTCHIGGSFGVLYVLSKGVNYPGDQLEEDVNCLRCHNTVAGDEPTIARCMGCHGKDKAKRALDLNKDVHMVDNDMLCQDCHIRFTDDDSDHQLAKGTCIDTTLKTAWGSLSDKKKDCAGCHGNTPHRKKVRRGCKLDKHCDTVACETCHTGMRTGGLALKSRSWQTFTFDEETGKLDPTDFKRMDDWVPVHKWYDGEGPPEEWPARGHLPILGPADMKDNPGAKIYPFNDIEVTWFIKDGTGLEPDLDDIIPLSEVKAAGITPPDDLTVTEAEMRAYDGEKYPKATAWTDTVCFNVSHSVVPKEEAFTCTDCHGSTGYVLNWEQLGYPSQSPSDPCDDACLAYILELDDKDLCKDNDDQGENEQ